MLVSISIAFLMSRAARTEPTNAGIALADEIWNLAELGYLEFQSSAALQNYLLENAFQVDKDLGAYLLPLSPAIDPMAQMMPIL